MRTRGSQMSAEGEAWTSAVPDVLGPGLGVLFCGINPGRFSDAAAAHFANPRNDFWRLLHDAGFTRRLLEPAEQFELLRYGVGVTNGAPTSRARQTGSSKSPASSARASSGSSARRPTAAPSESARRSASRKSGSATR